MLFRSNGIYTFAYDNGTRTIDLDLNQFKYTDVPDEASEQIEELRRALQAEQNKQQQLRHQRAASQMEADAVNQVQAEELQRMREALEASNRLVRQLKQQRHQDAASDEEDAQDTRKTLEMQGDKPQHVPVTRQKRCCKVGTGITYLTEVLTVNPESEFTQQTIAVTGTIRSIKYGPRQMPLTYTVDNDDTGETEEVNYDCVIALDQATEPHPEELRPWPPSPPSSFISSSGSSRIPAAFSRRYFLNLFTPEIDFRINKSILRSKHIFEQIRCFMKNVLCSSNAICLEL